MTPRGGGIVLGSCAGRKVALFIYIQLCLFFLPTIDLVFMGLAGAVHCGYRAFPN